MNNLTLFGEGYSYLVPLLLNKSGNGFIHSRFANGFNIKLGDSLVFIGTNKNGLLPFGIHLGEAETRTAVSSVNNSDSAVWNQKTNSLEFQTFTISLEKAKQYKTVLTKLKSEQVFDRSFELFYSHLKTINEQTGLDVSIRDFIDKFQADCEQNWLGVESYLIMLIKAAKTSDELLMDKALRYFLGRGNGLTPSGDDMIVGLLAFDAVSGFLSTRFYEKLSELIEGESITTDVAKEYLRYALKQEYSSTVSDMVNALASGNDSNFKQVFRNLLGVGHSSGLDTLMGILIGMITSKTTTNN
ncbi:DUF2877 domain-containing protein [Lysinibacillus yapensis]|uniref:DUF2877 domain-containing protein n=1 Tax=Ureibacillus yapensis TaxID=2304605 RepID=A0A396S898_9BACL|nr:DUF2877 domain-containing protein [Lysinibacillus yapensis]RHW34658.1 DUF2877 domain-containing protein [Lysinibacillus yapensis]